MTPTPIQDLPKNQLLRQAGYNPAHVYWPYESWGSGIEAAIKQAALIADDHSYTFVTTGQRYDPNNPQPVYGPKKLAA